MTTHDEITLAMTTEQADQIPADLLLDILRPTMGTDDSGCDARASVRWADAEGAEWTLEAFVRLVGGRYVTWTASDEAGVEDVAVLEAAPLAVAEGEAARARVLDIAGALGRVVSEPEVWERE